MTATGRRRRAADETTSAGAGCSWMRRQRRNTCRDSGFDWEGHYAHVIARGTTKEHSPEPSFLPGKSPARRLHVIGAMVLDHHHMKLTGRQKIANGASGRPTTNVSGSGEARHQIGKGLSDGGMDQNPRLFGDPATAKSPTEINASNLTADSNAMVSIRPWWCSVASRWRYRTIP